MAGVAASGMLAAAVLETAGYIAQEKILANFQDFFQGAGYLLFTLAAIGGVVSLTLFGSFRMPRYFLLGPILFYLLTGVTDTTGGVAWKLGGGDARVPGGKNATVQQSSDEIVKLAEKSLQSPDAPFPGSVRQNNQIQVSFVFRRFTDIVDRTVNSLMDLILHHENDSNLLFITRTKALETLLGTTTADPELMGMLRGDLLYKCNDMMMAAQELASPSLGFRQQREIQRDIENPLKEIERKMKEANLATLTARRDRLYKMYDQTSTSVYVEPSKATIDFMLRTQNNDAVSPTRVWLNDRNLARMEDARSYTMTCGELWQISADAIQRHASKFVTEWTDINGEELPNDRKRILCTEISRKIGRRTTDEDFARCDLVEVASVFLLRNMIAQGTNSQLVQRLKDDMQFLRSVKPGTVVMLDGTNMEQYELVGGDANFRTSVDSKFRWEALFRRKADGVVEWHPVGAVSQISGPLQTGYFDHQRLQTRELRQKAFTAAVLFPYLQGLLLYLFALAYPFIAIIVILPGRAVSFLNFFLLWMWVKSWSVAFAMVLVMDQVIWNLFPTFDFDAEFAGGAKLSDQPLPAVLSEAFKIDPTFNTHAYYFFLLMAFFAIPPLTAYAFLKGKNAIVAAFGEHVTEDSEDAANRAGGAYGIWATNARMQAFTELDGLSQQVHGYRGIGIEGNGRGQSAHMWSLMKTAGDVARGTASGGLLSSTFQNIADSPAKYVDNRVNFLKAELGNDIAYSRAFHPYFGRWGVLQMMSDAAAAGMDGEGGFEINENIVDDWVNSRARLFAMKIIAASDIATDVLTAQAGLGARVPGVGRAMSAVASFPAAQQLYQWFATQGQGMDNPALKKAFDQFVLGGASPGGMSGALSNQGKKMLGYSPAYLEKIFMINEETERGRVLGPLQPAPIPPERRNFSTEPGAPGVEEK